MQGLGTRSVQKFIYYVVFISIPGTYARQMHLVPKYFLTT